MIVSHWRIEIACNTLRKYDVLPISVQCGEDWIDSMELGLAVDLHCLPAHWPYLVEWSAAQDQFRATAR